MHCVIYLVCAMMFLNKNKCSYTVNNRKIDNNIEMLVKPMKILSGIFPNHEFEVQFNFEHVDYERPSKQINNKNPSHASTNVLRSKTLPKATPITVEDSAPASHEVTSDPNNPVVHMKDLKNALEQFEKKYSTVFLRQKPSSDITMEESPLILFKNNRSRDCVKKVLTTESTNSLSSFHDNPALSDVLQLIKRGAKLQHEVPNPGESDLSWLKIRVPTA